MLALFHWLLLVWHFVPWEREADPIYLVTGAWMAVAAVVCTFIALMKRWAGIAYIVLTCIAYCLYYFNRETDPDLANRLGLCLFPLDIIVCFLVLFFYKRLEGWPRGAK